MTDFGQIVSGSEPYSLVKEKMQPALLALLCTRLTLEYMWFVAYFQIQWVRGGVFGTPFGRAQGQPDQQSLLNLTLNGIAVNPNTASLVLVGDYTGDGIQFSGVGLPAAGSANVFVAHVAGDGTLAWAVSYSGERSELMIFVALQS